VSLQISWSLREKIRFKIRAYRRAADILEGLSEDAAELAREGPTKEHQRDRRSY